MKQKCSPRKMPPRRKVPRSIQGAWIGYQLKINGLTDVYIAKKVGVTQQMVQRVKYGLATSARVQKAIAVELGYASWIELLSSRKGEAA